MLINVLLKFKKKKKKFENLFLLKLFLNQRIDDFGANICSYYVLFLLKNL